MLVEDIVDEELKRLLIKKLLELTKKLHKIFDILIQIKCNTDVNVQSVQRIDEIIGYLESL